MPEPDSESVFDSLADRSRSLHGHKYVLPVAVWLLESEIQVISVREVMIGLGGRVDRIRVIEALTRLTSFGALRELPRQAPSAPRFFERVGGPYWEFMQDYATESGESRGDGG